MNQIQWTAPKGVILTRALAQDATKILAIVDGAYSKYIERIGKPPAPMLDDYVQVINDYDVFVLKPVSEEEAQRQSILACVVLKSCGEESDAILVDNIVVAQSAQGRGYGKALMDFVEWFATSKGKKSIELYTNVKMYENLKVYPKMRFVETGRKSDQGYERVYFRKTLGDGR